MNVRPVIYIERLPPFLTALTLGVESRLQTKTPLTQRQQLIADALRQRLREVYARAESIRPERFGAAQTDVAQIRDCIVQKKYIQTQPPPEWSSANSDCLISLRLLTTTESLTAELAQRPSDDFLERLTSSAKLPEKRFELLTNHYKYPLNFLLPSEHDVREHILERLMVPMRARIETASLNQINLDDLFLTLNFIALAALISADLRYIDALNYYFELLPDESSSHSDHGWLAVCYLSLYGSALLSTSERLTQCA